MATSFDHLPAELRLRILHEAVGFSEEIADIVNEVALHMHMPSGNPADHESIWSTAPVICVVELSPDCCVPNFRMFKFQTLEFWRSGNVSISRVDGVVQIFNRKPTRYIIAACIANNKGVWPVFAEDTRLPLEPEELVARIREFRDQPKTRTAVVEALQAKMKHLVPDPWDPRNPDVLWNAWGFAVSHV
jgi:hypothetical protein